MWTSPPISIRTLRLDDGSEKPQCLIVVYTESTVDIYDGFKGTWMQSINAKRVSPLESSSAQLSIHSGDDELKRLCILHFEANSEEIHLPQKIRPNARRNLQKLGKRKFVYKSANAERSKVPQIQIDYSWTLPSVSSWPNPRRWKSEPHLWPVRVPPRYPHGPRIRLSNDVNRADAGRVCTKQKDKLHLRPLEFQTCLSLRPWRRKSEVLFGVIESC